MCGRAGCAERGGRGACAGPHTWARRRRAAMGKSRARRFRRAPPTPAGPAPQGEGERGPEEEAAAELLDKVRAGTGGGRGRAGR